MDHFAGLDVSVNETSVCIVDDAGKIVREVKVASEPELLLAVLKNPAYHFKRTFVDKRSRPNLQRMTRYGHWPPKFAVMHNAAFPSLVW